MVRRCHYVSVPLRGKGRDQPEVDGETYLASLLLVSVPLRGKGRDQPAEDDWEAVRILAAVSVPLRGKGRDQLLPTYLEYLINTCFRPLAGKR